MPFKSEAQRRYLWMHDPAVAKKWAAEYPGQTNLPMHVDAPRDRKGRLNRPKGLAQTTREVTTVRARTLPRRRAR